MTTITAPWKSLGWFGKECLPSAASETPLAEADLTLEQAMRIYWLLAGVTSPISVNILAIDPPTGPIQAIFDMPTIVYAGGSPAGDHPTACRDGRDLIVSGGFFSNTWTMPTTPGSMDEVRAADGQGQNFGVTLNFEIWEPTPGSYKIGLINGILQGIVQPPLYVWNGEEWLFFSEEILSGIDVQAYDPGRPVNTITFPDPDPESDIVMQFYAPYPIGIEGIDMDFVAEYWEP